MSLGLRSESAPAGFETESGIRRRGAPILEKGHQPGSSSESSRSLSFTNRIGSKTQRVQKQKRWQGRRCMEIVSQLWTGDGLISIRRENEVHRQSRQRLVPALQTSRG